MIELIEQIALSAKSGYIFFGVGYEYTPKELIEELFFTVNNYSIHLTKPKYLLSLLYLILTSQLNIKSSTCWLTLS